jgi:ABC transporter substrate binding protein
MAYAIDLPDLYRRAAGQVVEILKGAKVSHIPFYQATTFKLVINLKTVKTLGLSVPTSLPARADEVIDNVAACSQVRPRHKLSVRSWSSARPFVGGGSTMQIKVTQSAEIEARLW